MIKALIVIVIVVAVALGGWQMFEYWDKVQNDKLVADKNAAAANITPESLSGLPYALDPSLKSAQQKGGTTLGAWLKTYGASVQDPRKAWIQLDYVILITRDNPQEAKRVFNEVRDRIPQSSPVWPRLHELEKSYQ